LQKKFFAEVCYNLFLTEEIYFYQNNFQALQVQLQDLFCLCSVTIGLLDAML